ncbi:MAG: phosphopantetheine-binding protein [Saprospiraceae bacterium]
MKTNLLDIVNRVRKNSGIKPISEIQPEMNLKNDLELDSISIAELVVDLDLAYNTNILADGMIVTVGDIVKRI